MSKNKFDMNSIKKIFSTYSMFFVLIIITAGCSLLNPHFLTSNNILNILRQQSVITLVAFGEMALIITGHLDLSIGSVIALSGVTSVMVYKSTQSLLLAFLASILIATVVSLLNALMVTHFKVPAFIATLSTMMIARGAALYITNGQNIYEIGDYTKVGQGSIAGIPIPVVFMIVIFIIIAYLMKHTKWGRSTYAVGGNADASLASGINVNWVVTRAFILNGVLVGIAAVLFMSRVNGGLPAGAEGYEMDALTATIIGGTSFTGGVGSPGGTVIGALIVGVLSNIMNLMSMDSYIQQMIRGAIIALAVIWDIYSKSKKSIKIKE